MSLRFSARTLVLGTSLCGAAGILPARVQAQENERHVVSQQELNAGAARPAEARQADEASVRQLLSSEPGQQALRSANVSYERVDKAIGQLSDEDLAKLAKRSRQAENDFAAGFISAKTLAYIILILVVIIVIAVLA
jgi:hypothetical protein